VVDVGLSTLTDTHSQINLCFFCSCLSPSLLIYVYLFYLIGTYFKICWVFRGALNLNDWIIIDDGLKYGINIEKDSKYFSESIPDWYKVTTLDAHTLELAEQRDKQNVRMTRILWKNNNFEKLLDLVVETIKNQNAEKRINELEKNINSKQVIREEWLKNVSCHNCGSKNIHKKNKRVYGYGTVQRYQCQDCKNIFQEEIQDNTHLDEIKNQVCNHHEECKDSLESNTVKNIQTKTNYFKEIYQFVKEKTGLIK